MPCPQSIRWIDTHIDLCAEPRPKKVVLLTDSLSVLQSLASGNPEDFTLRNLIQSLNSLTSRTTAVLQWIPAHTGIHGHEVADQLAKEGSKKQQHKSKFSYQEAKKLIRNKRLADFKHRNGGYNPQHDTLRLLSRHEQTMIFRLRTGPADWKHKPHVLQSCPLHKRERESTLPTEGSLGNKLHGTATDLHLTGL